MTDFRLWIIMLFGLPLSGKSTLRKNIHTGLQERGFAFQTLSVREEIEKRSQAGSFVMAEMKKLMNKGIMLPIEVPVSLFVDKAMSSRRYDGIITDGIGRRKEELEHIFDALFRIVPQNDVQVDAIKLNISWEEAQYRLREREKEGRLDDDPKIVRERFYENLKNMEEVNDYLGRHGFISIRTINGDGKQADEVYKEGMGRLGMSVS